MCVITYNYVVSRDPTSLNDTLFGGPCMAAYGGPVDPFVALGDFGKYIYMTIMYCIYYTTELLKKKLVYNIADLPCCHIFKKFYKIHYMSKL